MMPFKDGLGQVIKLSLALATAIPLPMGVTIMKASFRDDR
jgi:hypothetical protein